MKRTWLIIDEVQDVAEDILNSLSKEVEDLKVEGFQVKTQHHHSYYHLVVSFIAAEPPELIVYEPGALSIPKAGGLPKKMDTPPVPYDGNSNIKTLVGKITGKLSAPKIW